MDLLDPARSDSPPATALVAAIVVVHEGSALREALEAVERQVYELDQVIVVGDDSPNLRELAGTATIFSSVTEAFEGLDPSISHVWFLHDDSIPRPDALGALVREGGRVGAALVGSKVLRSGQPGMLESVGLATDVFEVPATGLDREEHDQEQYDVLRDVAFVAGSSILADRSYIEAAGGLDARLEPVTAALDLCQRVRLGGGRVVVVPSAEVLHDGTCAAQTKLWREEAGRLRSMLKAYSPVTLAWVIPFSFILGLMESVVSPLFGRWRLFGFVRAWVWNLMRLPSTIAARRRVTRAVGDEELFRFQVRGSARLTAFWQRVADKVVRLAESEGVRTFGRVVGSADSARRPVIASLVTAVVFALIATRSLWSGGVAAVGYALAPTSAVSEALSAYAGGWNPADLGSPDPLRPVVGAMALLQVALLGRASLALVVAVVAAAVAGVVGTARLLGPFGVRPAARYAAGVFLIGGPAVRVLAGAGAWHGVVAMAVLPWALSVIIHRRRTSSSIFAAALLTGLGAAFLPLMLVAPAAAILVWALVDWAGSPRYVGRALTALALAIPALLPWVATLDDPGFLFRSGPDFYWSPTAWVVLTLGMCTGAGLAGGTGLLSRATGWGALLAAGGAMLARTGGFGWGTDPGAAGMAVAGVGMAIVVGSALETGARFHDRTAGLRVLALAGAIAAGALVLGTATLAVPGRLGFPVSGLEEVLSFAVEAEPGRAVIIGDEELIPGGGEALAGDIHYRVVSTPHPRLWEAWPTSPRLGDNALTEILRAAVAGGSFRLGEDLAGFGIGWVVVTDEGPVVEALNGQLDLLPLAVPETIAFQVELPSRRAVSESGAQWSLAGTDYVGPSGSDVVFIAENADSRWGEEWEQAGWANRVTTDSGIVAFGPIGVLRSSAVLALLWVGLLGIATAGIRERAK